MKLLTNLPGNLRALFGFLRVVSIASGFFWFMHLLTVPVLWHFGMEDGSKMTLGEVTLRADPTAMQLKSADSKSDALVLHTLRGSLQADVSSGSPALRSAVLQTAIPYMSVMVLTAYLLFTALRKLCANLEVGEVFCEENLWQMRRIGLTLVVSSLINVALNLWASAIMGMFLRDQVVMTGGLKLSEFGRLALFDLPVGVMPIQTGLITGSLVLMLTEAFRQGLNLKTENDLTV